MDIISTDIPVGTATVEVLPDLSQFDALVAAAARRGLTVTTVTKSEYDEEGRETCRTTTSTVTAATED